MPNLETPEGWTKELYASNTPNTVVLFRPLERGGGMITVDFDTRAFFLGHGKFSRPCSTKKYTGRGWQKELWQDAIDKLENVMTREN